MAKTVVKKVTKIGPKAWIGKLGKTAKAFGALTKKR